MKNFAQKIAPLAVVALSLSPIPPAQARVDASNYVPEQGTETSCVLELNRTIQFVREKISVLFIFTVDSFQVQLPDGRTFLANHAHKLTSVIFPDFSPIAIEDFKDNWRQGLNSEFDQLFALYKKKCQENMNAGF